MINPSVMKGLAREHERDLLGLAVTPRRPQRRQPGVRERLGWSLVGLGARLALDAHR